MGSIYRDEEPKKTKDGTEISRIQQMQREVAVRVLRYLTDKSGDRGMSFSRERAHLEAMIPTFVEPINNLFDSLVKHLKQKGFVTGIKTKNDVNNLLSDIATGHTQLEDEIQEGIEKTTFQEWVDREFERWNKPYHQTLSSDDVYEEFWGERKKDADRQFHQRLFRKLRGNRD